MMTVGAPLVGRLGVAGVVIAELGLVLLPTAAWLWARRVPAAALGLGEMTARGRVRGLPLVGGVLAGAGAFYLTAAIVEPWLERVFPTPAPLREALQRMVAGRRPLALDLLAFAVAPAVSEELLFRGALFEVARRVLSRGAAASTRAPGPASSAATSAPPAATSAPPAASASQSATSAQPATTRAQPATTNASQSATSAQQSATSAQPATTNASQSATSAQQSTTSAQPATTGAQLATTSAQLATTSAQPATTGAQPATTGAQPGTTRAQPATTGAQPGTTRAQSAATRDAATGDLAATVTAIAISALAFGLFHGSPHRLLPATLGGLWLGAARAASGSLLPAIAFHAANNAGVVVALRLGYEEPPAAAAPLAVALAAVALGFALVARPRVKTPAS